MCRKWSAGKQPHVRGAQEHSIRKKCLAKRTSGVMLLTFIGLLAIGCRIGQERPDIIESRHRQKPPLVTMLSVGKPVVLWTAIGNAGVQCKIVNSGQSTVVLDSICLEIDAKTTEAVEDAKHYYYILNDGDLVFDLRHKTNGVRLRRVSTTVGYADPDSQQLIGGNQARVIEAQILQGSRDNRTIDAIAAHIVLHCGGDSLASASETIHFNMRSKGNGAR
jgi:hypothetical protein